MKRAVIFLLILFVLSSSYVYGFEATLLGLRKELFEKSKEIKVALTGSKDPILMSSLWDSCIMSMSQMDAYFAMLGILNTIKDKDRSEATLKPISGWLRGMKNTNELNVKSLDSVTNVFGQSTKKHIRILKTYFVLLSNLIDKELEKISLLEKRVKIRKKRR
ncbi:MAG: hypothetical protein NG737_04260 [Omnitrophica bacterium]|nr:hypothetical protein [Candidatus Omnitrophota bacterium]